ncbi:ion channel [Lichenibacterium dinghuense]|uniref:ion channel n=1 Tax=Lichenibacterium dinghuense TaxID=2895977 RepID=UPI001F177D11|nr:ion channel [Lichenibacterium sp. 6Y81]
MNDESARGRFGTAGSGRGRPRRLRSVTIGRRQVYTTGLKPSVWNDVYHVAMTARLPVFVAGLLATFLAINAVFAALYRLSPGSVANSGGDFENLFYFSAETLTTVGYGELFPQTRYGHILVSAEVFTGLFFTATMLGLIFARMSRPRARLLFARSLVIGPHDEVRTLGVRVANARLNVLASATARLWMLQGQTTREGVHFRRYVELGVLRSENPNFALSWTILHPIDAASPLRGRSLEDLTREEVMFMVVITGHDEASGQTVQASEYYLAADLRWDHRYADILSTSPDGLTLLDYDRFHDVEPVAAAADGREP